MDEHQSSNANGDLIYSEAKAADWNLEKIIDVLAHSVANGATENEILDRMKVAVGEAALVSGKNALAAKLFTLQRERLKRLELLEEMCAEGEGHLDVLQQVISHVMREGAELGHRKLVETLDLYTNDLQRMMEGVEAILIKNTFRIGTPHSATDKTSTYRNEMHLCFTIVDLLKDALELGAKDAREIVCNILSDQGYSINEETLRGRRRGRTKSNIDYNGPKQEQYSSGYIARLGKLNAAIIGDAKRVEAANLMVSMEPTRVRNLLLKQMKAKGGLLPIMVDDLRRCADRLAAAH